VCKKYFNPVPFCEGLKEKLIEQKAEDAISDLSLPFDPYTTCPECKRQIMAQTIAEVAHPAMARRKK
jgi:hypothetical protein